MVKWTQRLADAVVAIANYKEAWPYWQENKADVTARAKEFAAAWPGMTLKPHQVEFVSCLRSRLINQPSHKEFNAAWSEAWDADKNG